MLDWIDERTGLVSAWRGFADHVVPRGPSVRHVLPAVLVYLFAQQMVLGLLLATHYSPSATDAWASTAYIQDQISAGWFIRGLHHHGTSAMVLAVLAYLVQLAITGAFARPREFVWISTLGLLLVTMGLGVTGNVLPWDDQGYWAIQVELGIMEQTPGGGMLRTIVQGGSDVGNLTLTRMYAIHAFVLPAAGIAMLAGIIVLGRRAQRTETSGPRPHPGVTFFPHQMLLDMIAIVLVAAALVGVTVSTGGSELFAPADPTSTFQARPEWYFLPLFQLRMYFEGALEPIATMVIPGAVGGFLLVAPMLSAVRGRVGRFGVLTLLGFVMAGVVALTAISIQKDADNESYVASMDKAHKDAERARGFAKQGVVPEGGPAVFYNDPDYKVRKLYEEHCQTCHSLDGFGGDEAPTFTAYGDRAWLSGVIRNPKGDKYFAKAEIDDMEAYDAEALPDDQLAAVVEYLVVLSGSGEEVDAALAEKGKGLFADDLDCNSCHEVEAGVDGGGPNLLGHASAPWVARVIRDSSDADLYGEAAKMPKFADKLTDDEVSDLARFVVAQRGVVAEAVPPPDPAAKKKDEAEDGEAEDDDADDDDADDDDADDDDADDDDADDGDEAKTTGAPTEGGSGTAAADDEGD
jgi:ubiquinol-cytochrome c reductase cytochrome b subunit